MQYIVRFLLLAWIALLSQSAYAAATGLSESHGDKSPRVSRLTTISHPTKSHRRGKNARSIPAEPANPKVLNVMSNAALVLNVQNGEVIFSKKDTLVSSIASITKLMTAMVVIDGKQSLDERITLTTEDIDHLKNTGSRLAIGTSLTREDMLRLALMSSENRAASALGRNYPGGLSSFVKQMNLKAEALGMKQSTFVDSSGLSKNNVSTAQDLAKMVQAAYQYPLVRQFTTGTDYSLRTSNGRTLAYHNTNPLIRRPDWHIELSKTGYISEAGPCLVMRTVISGTPMVIVLLDSWGRMSRAGDANRIKHWIDEHIEVLKLG